MYKSKTNQSYGQRSLPFARDELWEGLPEATRIECVQLLTQLLREVVVTEGKEGQNDE